MNQNKSLALILAAGRCTRLGLDELPKCLIKLGERSLIEYQIECLKKLNIKKIFVVTGYNSEKIKEKLNQNNLKSTRLIESIMHWFGDFQKKIRQRSTCW